jgi:tRNA-specific adenosine deaminase 2
VFVTAQGTPEASSHNLTNTDKNASRHCEINCLEQLEQSHTDISKLSLFVTVEPCIMCTFALNIAGIAKVYFGKFNYRFGGCGSVLGVNKFEAVGGIKCK